MADVANTLAAWSSTTNSNTPSGATNISTGLDDNLREIQGVVVRGLSHKGSDIASSTTPALGATEGLFHDITGTTTITGWDTARAGIWKLVKFEGALTLTHNATSFILPGGANITTADGDRSLWISEGSGNWRCMFYQRTNGRPVIGTVSDAVFRIQDDGDATKQVAFEASGITAGQTRTFTLQDASGILAFAPTLGTQQASTSGTAIDFTSIPSWAKTIVIQLVGVSHDAASEIAIQLGDAGGVETTGYVGSSVQLPNAGSIAGTSPTGAFQSVSAGAGATYYGTVVLTMESTSFAWSCFGVLGRSDAATIDIIAGAKSTSAALDRVRVTSGNGTATFDAGAINILYW